MVPYWQVAKRFHRPEHWCHDLYDFLEVPCGHCHSCMQDKARRWAFRVQAEAQKYQSTEVWFFTFTYDERHLPGDGRPDRKGFSAFVKRLRKLTGPGLRFFACGELGEKTQRAHIHAVFFGHDFSRWKMLPYDGKQFVFPAMESVWRCGFCPGEPVRDADAVGAYVAKYQLKDYGRSGCWIHGSRRPGIGVEWIEDNFGSFGLCVLGNGKGGLLRSGTPKCIRERLGVAPDPEAAGHALVRLFSQMRASGYSSSQIDEYKYVERFRESLELVSRKSESFHKVVNK